MRHCKESSQRLMSACAYYLRTNTTGVIVHYCKHWLGMPDCAETVRAMVNDYAQTKRIDGDLGDFCLSVILTMSKGQWEIGILPTDLPARKKK